MTNSRTARHTILLPVDSSLRSDAAAPIAAMLARGLDAEVVLLHVTEVPESPAMHEDALRAADTTFQRLVPKIPVSVRTRVEEVGDPAEAIISVAAEERPDVIVMASRANFGLKEVTEGSVTTDVIRAGIAPVTVVYTPDAES